MKGSITLVAIIFSISFALAQSVWNKRQITYDKSSNIVSDIPDLPSTFQNLDSTFINVSSLDTTQFSDLFSYWMQVHITNSETIIDDINQNGMPELYGYTSVRSKGYVGPVKALELTTNGTFEEIFTYDSTMLATTLVDIRGSGLKSIYFVTIPSFSGSGCFYTSSNEFSVPDSFDFILNNSVAPGYINEIAFGDFNKNGLSDYVLDCRESHVPSFAIAEYDSLINNYSTKFSIDYLEDINVSGFCIDDFDSDEKDEIIFNYDNLGYYVVEAENNNYEIVNHGSLPISYPWLHAKTNDIDGNGKKEFWIGQVKWYPPLDGTLYAFEAVSDNNYEPVAKIYLQGLSSGHGALSAIDIDNDNKQEIILTMLHEIIILKFSGSQGNHKYSVFYYKKVPSNQPKFGSCSFYDLNKDGLKDLIVSFSEEIMTQIFKQNSSSTVSVETENANKFDLFQNYPNPFNPATKIKYSIPRSSKVDIRIYDILGKEIETLLNEENPAGTYELTWNAASLPSGIYFYQIKAGDFMQTKKMILLR